MGHVIIISQAIVHACSDDDEEEMFGAGDPVMPTETDPGDNRFKEVVERCAEYEEWQSFIMSTLANETAIQSTPLGGFNSPTRQDNLSDEDFGLDAQDMDIAASMIASLNMAANGAGGGVKLGMGGLTFDSNTMRSLGLALNGLGIEGGEDGDGDDDEFKGVNGGAGHHREEDDDDDSDEDGNKNYYDDIINSVNNGKKGFGVGGDDDDMVEVLEDSSDEEDTSNNQNLFNPSFADFDSGNSNAGAGKVEAWGGSDQEAVEFEANFGDVESIPPGGKDEGANGNKNVEGSDEDGGKKKDTWADPFEDFAGSSSARSDFFG